VKAYLDRFRLITPEERRLAILGCCFFAFAVLFHVLAASERNIPAVQEHSDHALIFSDGRMVARGLNNDSPTAAFQLP
jgi:hypothetical protein